MLWQKAFQMVFFLLCKAFFKAFIAKDLVKNNKFKIFLFTVCKLSRLSKD